MPTDLRLLPILLATVFASGVAVPAPALAQDAPATGPVSFQNPNDQRPISGSLTLPSGEGPFPGVVVLTLAGVDPLVERLTGLGYAVLRTERRGMVSVEQLLRASLHDLGGDVLAAVEYLRGRSEIDPSEVFLLAQGEEVPAAMAAAATAEVPFPTVFLSASGLPGREAFRLEQIGVALERLESAEGLDALARYADQIASAVLDEPSPEVREARLLALIAESEVQLPRGAALPDDPQGQARFFASQWWWDRLNLRSDEWLARTDGPVLVLMGQQDYLTPWERHVPALRRHLEAVPSGDATLCLLPGRVRHTFSEDAIDVVVEWLVARRSRPAQPPEEGPTARVACVPQGLAGRP